VTARLLGLQASIILGFALVSCGGSAAPAASSPAPSQAPASSPAAKPAGSESASAKPAASTAASPSAAASASAKPAASPKPAPTTLPPIPADTTTVALTKVAIPPIAGKTLSADTLDVDQAAHVLYATDRTAGGIDVFDVSTPSAKYLTTIKTPAESHGITVAKDINRLFAGQTGSKLAIIDIDPKSPTVNTVIATVDTGGKLRADELAYDPKDKKVYISNIDEGFVVAIDVTTNKVTKRFDNVGKKVEQPIYNPADGMVYMDDQGQNAIFQFDPAKDALLKTFDIGDDCQPAGEAVNPATSQVLLGCTNRTKQHTAVFDLKSGKLAGTFDNTGAGDMVVYDPKADRFLFAVDSFFRGASVGVFGGAAPVKFITNVPTSPGSHTLAYDETNKIVYVPDVQPNDGALLSFPLPAK